MKEQITDTDRLNFITELVWDHHVSSIDHGTTPGCKCGCCNSYIIEINNEKYFEEDLRTLLDNLILKFKGDK